MDCQTAVFKLLDLTQTPCQGKDMHSKVLNAAYMCQNCPAICDDLTAFETEACPCRFDVESPPVAAPPSPSPSESAKGAGLSIKRRAGKIGGTFMEVPVQKLPERRCPVGEDLEATTRARTPVAPRPSCRSAVADLTFFPAAPEPHA